MPITAPRYTPGGVNVGSMPVPTVKAQTGMAEGLAAIGDTIASLGKTTQRVVVTQERRQQIKADNEETAGENAFRKWKQQMDTAYQKYGIEAHGELVGVKRDEFLSTVTGDDSSFTADLSEGARLAFAKRKEFQTVVYRDSSGTLALDRNRKFIVDVAKSEVDSSIAQAGTFVASGDEKAYQASLGRAWEAAKRISPISGQSFNYDDFRAQALYAGMQEVKKNGSPEAVAEYYQKYTGAFDGTNLAFEGSAKTLAQDSLDEMQARSLFSEAVAAGSDPKTGFDAQKAVDALPKDLPSNVQAKVMDGIQKAAQADMAQRKLIATEFMDRLDDAAERGITPGVFYSDPMVEAAYYRMTPSQKAAVWKREEDIKVYGTKRDNPGIATMLDVSTKSYPGSARYQWAMTVDVSELPLTAASRQGLLKWRTDQANRDASYTEDEMADKVLTPAFEANRKMKLPSFSASKELDPEQLSTLEEYKIFSAEVMRSVRETSKKSGKPITQTDINAEAMRRLTPIEVPAGNMWGGDVKTIPAYQHPDFQGKSPKEFAAAVTERQRMEQAERDAEARAAIEDAAVQPAPRVPLSQAQWNQ